MSTAAPPDQYVDHDGTELAVRDHGGEGPPLLLLHGAGRTLADWVSVAPLLARRHRVVAMDLRAHGRSAPGPWTFPLVLGDVEAVLRALGMPDATLVGHSLGGMVATLYTLDHPDTPAAVNLDGTGFGRPEQYVGLDPAYVEERLAEIGEFARQAASRTFSAQAMEDTIAAQLDYGRTLGIAPELLETGLRRALREDPGGRLYLRPERDPALQMLAAMDEFDLFRLHRRVAAPVLICRARRLGPAAPGLPWLDELMAAYAVGLDRDLDRLAEVRPNVTVERVDATHAMLLERPAEVAERVLAFTAARRGA